MTFFLFFSGNINEKCYRKAMNVVDERERNIKGNVTIAVQSICGRKRVCAIVLERLSLDCLKKRKRKLTLLSSSTHVKLSFAYIT
ncbi:hypothetical protein PUN28_014893 [Cardiocondyla obscurior]|uniref:Uncharacterized protein n=1 Tax=Cardiocondyla obscurior TaxID=286306 RepID=A0AAW2EZ51_9HYME